jgi:hypothetical protein
MKNVPLIDELRATRQRLAQEVALDVERYAAMLRGVAENIPGDYVTEPFLPLVETSLDTGGRKSATSIGSVQQIGPASSA